MKNYFYNTLRNYLSIYVRQDNSIVEINPSSNALIRDLKNRKIFFTESQVPGLEGLPVLNRLEDLATEAPDYILVSGNIHYEKDIQTFFEKINKYCPAATRLVIVYYSRLWKPFIQLATFFKLRERQPEENWIAHQDIDNFLILSDFEFIKRDSKILIPFYIPFISAFINRYLAPLPLFNWLTMVNIVVAKPLLKQGTLTVSPSVSIVIAARNEEGNIENIVKRIPKMGPDDEIIFIEGNSTDNTWEKIKEIQKKYALSHAIIIGQQDGKGKGDAVRKGFEMASKEILMILDADLTVPAEDLPKFYKAIVNGKGEFINGSRLVYPMESQAMRFFNILGNKFFAFGFSHVLGQRFKDTLCGTKVLTKENYLKIIKNRHFFGDFDPFGDFDLIFGASRLTLKTIEVPISYKDRTYGSTNISRWKHGVILLRMLFFVARKIKYT
jgi:hypothetical protein